MRVSTKTKLSPKKLLLSKWTAVLPQDKEKHFLVTKLVPAGLPAAVIETVEMEAVHSRRSFLLPWRELANEKQWLRGWK